jgi:fructoselysine-6-P-deglycase FrlB-like protein
MSMDPNRRVEKLEEKVGRALTSELFSSSHLEADLQRFFQTEASHLRELAAEARSGGIETVYFVGSGGSWSSMYSGKYLCDRLLGIPAELSLSYELCWRAPVRLNERSLVFLASYSGATADTIAALELARTRGARTVGLVNSADTPIGSRADDVIAYRSPGLYSLPMAAVSVFAAEWARLDGHPEAQTLAAALETLPTSVGAAFRSEKERGRALAEEFADSSLLYCIGSGPLYGLAYKFALTVFMENLRTHGSIVESAEFRHGPAEMLERQRPDLVFLVGTDESRAQTLATLEFARGQGARTAVFDASSYASVHPLLTAFVLKVALQWFIVYGALLRGIDDLDARVYMGHGVLAGKDAAWP